MKLLVVDDHPLVRSAVADLLTGLHKCILQCMQADGVTSALTVTEEIKPDVTILDLVMGGRDGVELVADLKNINPLGRILVYSALDEKLYALRALRAGAHGYLMKTSRIDQLNVAFESISSGDRYVSEKIQQSLMSEFFEDRLRIGAEAGCKYKNLSNRELQILKLLQMEFPSTHIARDLKLSVKTVGTYCERLKNKLSVQTVAELRLFPTTIQL